MQQSPSPGSLEQPLSLVHISTLPLLVQAQSHGFHDNVVLFTRLSWLSTVSDVQQYSRSGSDITAAAPMCQSQSLAFDWTLCEWGSDECTAEQCRQEEHSSPPHEDLPWYRKTGTGRAAGTAARRQMPTSTQEVTAVETMRQRVVQQTSQSRLSVHVRN